MPEQEPHLYGVRADAVLLPAYTADSTGNTYATGTAVIWKNDATLYAM